jgi:tetratricopeptide (TPR) repeat protein
MKGGLLFLLLLLCCSANTQELQKKLDSLSVLISTMPPEDTATINLRNDYIKQLLFLNPADSSLSEFAQQTLETAERAGYHKGVLLAYERLALISQYSFSNPFKALDYYHKALTIAENNPGLSTYKWGVLGGIATIYYEQEEYRRALGSFFEIVRNNKDLELTATANIANVYGAMEMVDSSIYYYHKALDHQQLEGNPTFRANLYSNLSLMYEKAGNVDSAVICAEKSLGLINTHGIEFVRPTAYANASMAYLMANDYTKAEYYARESLKLSDLQGNLFLQKSAWGTLAEVFAAKNDYQSALDAYIRYSALKDSLNNQNRRVEINRKQMEFDFEKERALTQTEIARQTTMKKVTLLGGFGLLIISTLGFILYRRRRDALEQRKEAEFKALVADTELKALRSQMNPHFIFNSLNSIGDYILKNDNQSAQEYLMKFAKLMRTVLENSEFKEIPLSEELAFIELYLQVETKRLPGKFSFVIHVENGLDTENILVPPLLFQPFIENSIWHGFKEKESQGILVIDFKRKDDMLLCCVDDDGQGRINNNTGSGNKSLGIAITENRIQIMNKQKNANGQLLILPKPNNTGTRVEVSLPLQTAF